MSGKYSSNTISSRASTGGCSHMTQAIFFSLFFHQISGKLKNLSSLGKDSKKNRKSMLLGNLGGRQMRCVERGPVIKLGQLASGFPRLVAGRPDWDYDTRRMVRSRILGRPMFWLHLSRNQPLESSEMVTLGSLLIWQLKMS